MQMLEKCFERVLAISSIFQPIFSIKVVNVKMK